MMGIFLKMVIMMKKNSNLILIVTLIVVVLAIVYIPNILRNNKKSNYDINDLKFEKKTSYKPNEIIPVYVDDKQMSKIYLNDFINKLIYDIDGSYDLIDSNYKKYNFVSLNDYKEFIYNMEISMNNSISKYATYERLGYKYYDLYDKDGHRFIFKTDGVLQYKVLFDDIEEGEED